MAHYGQLDLELFRKLLKLFRLAHVLATSLKDVGPAVDATALLAELPTQQLIQ